MPSSTLEYSGLSRHYKHKSHQPLRTLCDSSSRIRQQSQVINTVYFAFLSVCWSSGEWMTSTERANATGHNEQQSNSWILIPSDHKSFRPIYAIMHATMRGVTKYRLVYPCAVTWHDRRLVIDACARSERKLKRFGWQRGKRRKLVWHINEFM